MGKDSISGKSQLPSLDLLNRQEPSVATENVEVKKKRIAEVFHAYKIAFCVFALHWFFRRGVKG